jgi:hypothetical protein
MKLGYLNFISSNSIIINLKVHSIVRHAYINCKTVINENNPEFCDSRGELTCGILNRRSRFATWIEVTLDAAPTTPEITLRTCVLLQWYSAPSILLIDPEMKKKYDF